MLRVEVKFTSKICWNPSWVLDGNCHVHKLFSILGLVIRSVWPPLELIGNFCWNPWWLQNLEFHNLSKILKCQSAVYTFSVMIGGMDWIPRTMVIPIQISRRKLPTNCCEDYCLDCFLKCLTWSQSSNTQKSSMIVGFIRWIFQTFEGLEIGLGSRTRKIVKSNNPHNVKGWK